MRRRVVRDIGTILGIVVILAGVVLVNGYMRRGNLTDQMDKMRSQAEANQKTQGIDLLQWDLLRRTTGTSRSGPTFDQRLIECKGQPINLVGFMVPLYEFRQVTEFLLLPLPIECYFCQMPPMREVVLVQMAEGERVDIVKEPVLVSGNLTLNEGAGTKFFYVVKDATRNAAQKGGKMHKRSFEQQHIQHAIGAKQAEEAQSEPLLPGQEPAKTPQPAPPAPASPK